MDKSFEKNTIATVKTWLFPTLFTMFSYMLYDDIKEIKSDVKILLTKSASDHTEIINLKENILNINKKVFSINNISSNNKKNYPFNSIKYVKLLGVIPDDKYYKKRNI
jgi:hypothetical protein